jgi:hypothetical protein
LFGDFLKRVRAAAVAPDTSTDDGGLGLVELGKGELGEADGVLVRLELLQPHKATTAAVATMTPSLFTPSIVPPLDPSMLR